MCERAAAADHPRLLIPRKALKIAMVLNLSGKTCAGQLFLLTTGRLPKIVGPICLKQKNSWLYEHAC